MSRTEKQMSYEERYKAKMEMYAEAYKIRTDFASKFKLKPEKTKGYYNTGDIEAVGGGSDAKPEDGEAATAVSGNSNEEKVWNFLAGKGMTAAAAAGIMGNLKQESGIDPKKKQYGGGPGRGLCQWETKHSRGGGRWNTLVAWAHKKGLDEWDIVTQLGFMWKELTEGYVLHLLNKNWGGIEGLKKATDYKWAVDAFEKTFERAGKPNLPQRYKYAKAFLAQYGKGGGSRTATATTGGNTTTTATASTSSVKFQVTRDIRIQETDVDVSAQAEYEEDYNEPMVTPVGVIKNDKYLPPSIPRAGYARGRLDDARLSDWESWAPLNGKDFIHLAGPQENLYAREARNAFQLLRQRLGWDKIKVVHGFQHRLEPSIISMHNIGMAMDIYVENIYEAIYVADTAWVSGFRAIAIGGSELDEKNAGFVHVDCGPNGSWPLNHHDVYKGPNTFRIIKR